MAILLIQDKLVNTDVAQKLFACDLGKCKGACCVAGDLGAPLDRRECEVLEDIYEDVKPYMREEGIAAVREQGTYVYDFTGSYSTPLVNGRECAYVVFESGIAFCAIEKAWKDEKIDFQKPISCHLYPIRISRTKGGDRLDYDVWDVCAAACVKGEQTQLSVYEFLKEPLIRKYGAAFYEELDAVVRDWKAQRK